MWNGEGRDSAYDVVGARRAEGERALWIPCLRFTNTHDCNYLRKHPPSLGQTQSWRAQEPIAVDKRREREEATGRDTGELANRTPPGACLSLLETERPAVEISFGAADNTSRSWGPVSPM